MIFFAHYWVLYICKLNSFKCIVLITFVNFRNCDLPKQEQYGIIIAKHHVVANFKLDKSYRINFLVIICKKKNENCLIDR